MGKLEFNPPNLYEDEVAFPDPSSETETRRQLNEGCKQIQEFINANIVENVYTKNEVDTKISQAIGDAIGGEF